MDKITNLWLNYEEWKAAREWRKRKELEYGWFMRYGYRGEADGFHKWLDTKFKEQQSGNEQGSLPLKDSGKILAGNRNSTLLCITEGNNLLQNETLCIPSSPIKSLNSIQYRIAVEIFTDKIRGALRKANESKI